MSDETKKDLEDALAELNTRRAAADAEKQACLSMVAAGMGAAVEMIAKSTAHAQAEVTKELGPERIQALRADLASMTAEVAADLEDARERIEWPRAQSEYSLVDPRKVHSALFNYLYGARVNKIAAVFKRHGFAVQDDNAQRSQGLILPQYLYDEDTFEPVAASLNALAKAERAHTKAKTADDESIVNSIWGDD